MNQQELGVLGGLFEGRHPLHNENVRGESVKELARELEILERDRYRNEQAMNRAVVGCIILSSTSAFLSIVSLYISSGLM